MRRSRTAGRAGERRDPVDTSFAELAARQGGARPVQPAQLYDEDATDEERDAVMAALAELEQVQPEDVPSGPLAIDTDAFSAVHWGRGRQAEFDALIAGHQLAMPFPVVGELKVGAIRGRLGEKRLEALGRAIGACVVIPTDARVVEHWAAMRSKLINQLKGEGINDLWTAACCLVHELPLVTNNLTDFQIIGGIEPRLRLVHPDLDPPRSRSWSRSERTSDDLRSPE